MPEKPASKGQLVGAGFSVLCRAAHSLFPDLADRFDHDLGERLAVGMLSVGTRLIWSMTVGSADHFAEIPRSPALGIQLCVVHGVDENCDVAESSALVRAIAIEPRTLLRPCRLPV